MVVPRVDTHAVTRRRQYPRAAAGATRGGPRVMSGTWEDAFALFDAALTMTGGQREAFLAQECGTDVRLRTKVESLLEAHRDAQGFLSSATIRATHASGDAV